MTSTQTYTDKEIIAGLKNRDSKAFKELYHSHTAKFKLMIIGQGGSQDDADEIEQLVIINLYEKVMGGQFQLNENTKLSTYLYAVARNIWYKKATKKYQTVSIDNKNIVLPEIVEEIDIQIDPIEDEEQLLINAIKKIGDSCKQILTKFYYEKKSMRQIAIELVDISEENLRKRKYKCIQKLKKLFEKEQKNG
jgi:RNA polymerase sigma factor (sigma-70 family)